MTYEERAAVIMKEEGPKHQICKDLVIKSTNFGQYSYECRRRAELVEHEREKKQREALIAKQPKNIQE